MLKLTLLTLMLSVVGLADTIIFTIQGTGSGTVNSTAFTNQSFTLTVTTDTTLVTAFNLGDGETGFQTPNVAGAGISIGGIGSGTFTDVQSIFVNNTSDFVGITDGVSGNDLVDGFNSSFTTYTLQTSIGPVPIAPLEALDQFNNISTTLGNVTFTMATNVFFTATTVFTPEPGTTLLAAAGVLLLGLGIRARARGTGR